jgi:hypothetical protein
MFSIQHQVHVCMFMSDDASCIVRTANSPLAMIHAKAVIVKGPHLRTIDRVLSRHGYYRSINKQVETVYIEVRR